MKILLISTLLATVTSLPQYDYPQSSVGFKLDTQTSRGYPGNNGPGGNGFESNGIGSNSLGGNGIGSNSLGGNGFGSNELGSNARPSAGRPDSKYLPSDAPEQPPLVQKHVYLHVPPPELEEAAPTRKPIPRGRKEKHYKIIFVKAPVAEQAAAPIIPPQADKEEKTIVYVLLKKPEEAADIVIPTPAPTEPVKPEVYFIRYKSMKKGGGGEDEGYPDGRPSNGGQNGGPNGGPNGGQIGGQNGGQNAGPNALYGPPRRS